VTPQAILAIDAAWTSTQPSGVALLSQTAGGWNCSAIEASYGAFINLSGIGAAALPLGNAFQPALLLSAAKALNKGVAVDLIAVDMPMSTVNIVGRRTADSAISRAFGAKGCSTHTPSANRPGPMAMQIPQLFGQAGYHLSTLATPVGTIPSVIEVYPHPALLALTNSNFRLPYKLSGLSRYWRNVNPTPTVATRKAWLVAEWERIWNALAMTIMALPPFVPPRAAIAGMTGSQLKAVEDKLDALVCGWVGIKYLAGQCSAYGDATAAIWTP